MRLFLFLSMLIFSSNVFAESDCSILFKNVQTAEASVSNLNIKVTATEQRQQISTPRTMNHLHNKEILQRILSQRDEDNGRYDWIIRNDGKVYEHDKTAELLSLVTILVKPGYNSRYNSYKDGELEYQWRVEAAEHFDKDSLMVGVLADDQLLTRKNGSVIVFDFSDVREGYRSIYLGNKILLVEAETGTSAKPRVAALKTDGTLEVYTFNPTTIISTSITKVELLSYLSNKMFFQNGTISILSSKDNSDQRDSATMQINSISLNNKKQVIANFKSIVLEPYLAKSVIQTSDTITVTFEYGDRYEYTIKLGNPTTVTESITILPKYVVRD